MARRKNRRANYNDDEDFKPPRYVEKRVNELIESNTMNTDYRSKLRWRGYDESDESDVVPETNHIVDDEMLLEQWMNETSHLLDIDSNDEDDEYEQEIQRGWMAAEHVAFSINTRASVRQGELSRNTDTSCISFSRK